jgi:hypothetical protein
MVSVGTLVQEDCSSDSKPRTGTVVKVTDIVLHHQSQWKQEVDKWVSYNNNRHPNGDKDPCMEMCYIVRPGKVASVRWQHDPTKLTVHVFYNDCNGRSHFNHGSNGVEVLQK